MELNVVENPTKKITLNVSGEKHEISEEILNRYPNTRLGRVVQHTRSKQMDTNKSRIIFFDRPSDYFKSILAYYFTNELHMPNHICPKAFQKELRYWDIDEANMEPCCRFRYLSFFQELDTISSFQDYIHKDDKGRNTSESSFQRCKAKVWSVLEHDETTMIADVFMWLMLLCVGTSVITLSIGTLDQFRVELNVCEIHDHLLKMAQEGMYSLEIINIPWTNNCSQSMEDVENHLREIYDQHINDTQFALDETHIVTPEEFNKMIQQFHDIQKITKRIDILTFIDIALLVVFALEFSLRVIFCPSARAVFLSVLNLLDFIVLAATFAELIVEFYFESQKYENKGVKVLYYLQMLRVLRIIRYVQQCPSVRVLGYTVKNSYKDLTVLLLFILVGIVLFSNFIFFAESEEDFPSIPDSWWWGIITMTTIGYGDMVPKTPLGKVIGSFCALSGVLVLSLTIPIFVNTFVTLYNFSHVYERFISENDKKQKTEEKKKSTKERKTQRDETGFNGSSSGQNKFEAARTDSVMALIPNENSNSVYTNDRFDSTEVKTANGSTKLSNGNGHTTFSISFTNEACDIDDSPRNLSQYM